MRKIRGDLQCINNENKGSKNMLKNGIESEWLINTRIHAYIAWFGHMHARHLVGIHDRHLAFMQA